MNNYIFGYGSLIETESRLRTTPNAKEVFPIKVMGLKRGWFARTKASGLSTTFLGCIKEVNNFTNGVIYKVNKKDLELTDKRESGYKRIKILFNDIIDFNGILNKDDQIWVYINSFDNNIIPKSEFPNKKFPIVQSYVDICINGCLEIEEQFPKAKEQNFLKEFINSTHYWNSFWANDRIYPRRPFIYQKNAYKIDSLLKLHLSDKTIFNNIYIE